MTKVALIRHGSTPWNKEKRAQGTSDIRLDEEGKGEAIKLAERLKNGTWDVLYSSPLLRAKQTAEFISEKVGLDILFDSRLKEAGGGQIEGTTEIERKERWGNDWRTLDLGMEKPEKVVARGIGFMSEVLDKHENQSIIVVSHGAWISHLLRELDEDNIGEEHMKNASFSEVFFREGKWFCDRFNCTLHLE
ncbi:histidine phosphatase family protein [Halobacillus karajensis]|uniref:Phosphoserine phosphatase 1 n=1 Tax=Halobacillus karajensis TaxID=195088 RepID=A0A059NUW9_9BACI|nr:histidine phosphatase family protein [Halobacillus karajensis]CDQ19298.1 Phosphoserine phosphatase 1 [Halobacillus karajensis]CDQ22539.1 Phosphoserine phosphatase 1 [Halobacillus karajensis]CDQ26021.1 Phosphoserine phosphatase 1 [Halobacillus karajensis]